MRTPESKESHWLQVHVPLPADSADFIEDLLSGALPELGALGLEYVQEPRAIEATFRSPLSPEALIQHVKAGLEPYALRDLEMHAKILHLDDWAPYWQQAFEPLRFGPLAIVPSWAERPTDTEHVLILDPSQAFGTGLHPTTALCLQALLQNPPKRLLDVGTGSGVLSLGCLLLGTKAAVGIDIDARAIDAARIAAETNDLLERFTVSESALHEVQGDFPVVVANVRPQPLLALAPDLCDHVESGGRLLLSGMKSDEVAQVQAAFEALGMALQERLEQEGWVALHFEAPSPQRQR